MIFLLSFAAVALAGGDDIIAPSGAALRPGTTCFEVLRGERTVGMTRQTVRETLFDGSPAWEIVIHQRLPAVSFEMRDRFVLAKDDLHPYAFFSERGRPGSPRWRSLWVRYDADRIVGVDENGAGSTPINVHLDHRVWDGNLWGVTFASLPLAAEGRYTLPTWHYDKGFGSFEVRVMGRETLSTPDGTVEGWRVQASDGGDGVADYIVDLASGEELAYSAGPFSQRLGGTCAMDD